MQSGDDSLWESFPHALESLEGARRYISAFRAPLQELSAMSLAQIHTLRACSFLVISPPPDRMPTQGGFPTDLLELNLSGWATLVQDIVAGLPLLLPPGLPVHMHGSLPASSPQSWSQIVEQTPGYGVTASSGGMTTPTTTVAGMSGYLAPPPGLTPPDFSSWRLLPPEAPHLGDYPQLHKAYLASGGPS